MDRDAEILSLERISAAALARVHREFLHDAHLTVSDSMYFITNELALKLEKHIWANPLGRLEVSYPATPWEHFRATYFPKTPIGRWFLKRKPVRKTCVVRSAYAAFPEAHVRYPDELRRCVMMLRETPNYTAA
jgi:hypothetical protein